MGAGGSFLTHPIQRFRVRNCSRFLEIVGGARCSVGDTRRRLAGVGVTCTCVRRVGTVVGFTAPLCGPIAGIYAYLKRESLAGENGTFLALGYGSASLGAVYALMVTLLTTGLM